MSNKKTNRPVEVIDSVDDSVSVSEEVPVAVVERGLGWAGVSPKSDHDYHYAAHLGTSSFEEEVPRSASVRDLIVPFSGGHIALDQLAPNSCISNAIAMQIRIDWRRQGIMAPLLMSRRFNYHTLRAYNGDQKNDVGGYIRNGYRALQKFGFCTEDKCKYDVTKINEAPLPDAYMEAFDQKTMSAYYRLDLMPLYLLSGEAKANERLRRKLLIRKAVANKQSVTFGTRIRPGFSYDRAIEDVPGPESDGRGHAMLIIGYDGDESVDVLNSWGAGSGKDGVVKLTWDYILWDHTEDMWVSNNAPIPSR